MKEHRRKLPSQAVAQIIHIQLNLLSVVERHIGSNEFLSCTTVPKNSDTGERRGGESPARSALFFVQAKLLQERLRDQCAEGTHP